MPLRLSRHVVTPALAGATVAAAALLPTTAIALHGTSPTLAAAAASTGSSHACTKHTDQESDSSHKYDITSGGLDRSYDLRLPADYDKRDDWPLIVAYHGRGSTGVEVEGFSELSKLPAIVAYPDGETGTGSGYRKAWQGAPYEPPNVDDVAFTSDLLDHLESDYCVDPTRVYATGKSNGAGFAALLACQLPGRFAAIAPVAPALYPGARQGCTDAPPTPILEIHGQADATIPYSGDADRDLPAIPDWVRGWADRGACTTSRSTKVGTDVTITRWLGCADGSEVEHVAVAGGGHVWPGSDIYSGGGHVTHTIEASKVIWDFFSRHRLSTASSTEG